MRRPKRFVEQVSYEPGVWEEVDRFRFSICARLVTLLDSLTTGLKYRVVEYRD